MTKEKIMEVIGAMDNIEVIDLWNECIKNTDYSGDEVFLNSSEIFNKMFGNAYNAILAVACGNWDWRDSDVYVAFDSDKNVYSFTYWEEVNSPIDAHVLANWLLKNQKKLKNRH